jgi:DNA-binding MarR family transcriptional regulator
VFHSQHFLFCFTEVCREFSCAATIARLWIAPYQGPGIGVSNMSESITPDRVYFRFIRQHQRVYAEIGQTLRQIGLSIPQFDVLSTLTEQEGVSQTDLAARLYVTKGNVSGLVDRLVEAGLVERRNAPGDRRSNAVFLTPEGRKVAEEGIRLQRIFVGETLGRLQQSDLALLDAILTQWRDAVRARTNQRSPKA